MSDTATRDRESNSEKSDPQKGNPKSFQLSPELHAYMLAHGTQPDSIQQGLIQATESLGGIAIMQIAPEQGADLP